MRAASGGTAKPQHASTGADAELPIDINYRNLTDWLVSRKKLVPDWRKRLAVLQTQTAELAKDLPAGLINSVNGQESAMHYETCKKVLDKLSQTNERGLFGGLTGPAKEWAKVVRVYEKGNVYLGEAAQMLITNADYEIPFLRKSATSLDNQLVDLRRKMEELRSSAQTAARSFKQECEDMGIQGSHVQSELLGLVHNLPGIFTEVISKCRQPGVSQGIDYYNAFLAYSMSSGGASLTALCEVIHGTTCAPVETIEIDVASQQPIEIGIDWGLGQPEEVSESVQVNWGIDAPGVDWDIGVPDASESAPTVDWDVDIPAADECDGADYGIQLEAGAESSAVIDWGIDLTAEGRTEEDQTLSALTEGVSLSGKPGGSESGEAGHEGDACVSRLVGDVQYRNNLIADLSELQAFLFARHSELREQSSALLTTSIPEAIQQVGADSCSDMLANVTSAVSAATDERLRQLLMLKTSPQYLARVHRALEMKASHEPRYLSALREVESKESQTQRTLVLEAPKLKALLSLTAQLKTDTEAALSSLLGRRANIVGEINLVLNKQ